VSLDTATGLHTVHTHVWFLGGDNFASLKPEWGWVAMGPKGTLAGACTTAQEARDHASCARFLVTASKPV
jgi:hypothetical protein